MGRCEVEKKLCGGGIQGGGGGRGVGGECINLSVLTFNGTVPNKYHSILRVCSTSASVGSTIIIVVVVVVIIIIIIEAAAAALKVVARGSVH